MRAKRQAERRLRLIPDPAGDSLGAAGIEPASYEVGVLPLDDAPFPTCSSKDS